MIRHDKLNEMTGSLNSKLHPELKVKEIYNSFVIKSQMFAVQNYENFQNSLCQKNTFIKK